MRFVIAFLVFSVTAPLAARGTRELAPPPPGTTLPVIIYRTLKPQKLRAGDLITAELVQMVPIATQVDLPKGTNLIGHVVNVSDSAVSILFDQLHWKGRSIPVHVRLMAAAASNNVYETKRPLSAPDRSTSNPGDWTTRQVGGDEVYLSGGSGKVYDRYSEPVGYADFSGVYANPSAPGKLPRAMGPFSTTAEGLHGFPAFSIVSQGGTNAPITLASRRPNWQIAYGSALLLEVVR